MITISLRNRVLRLSSDKKVEEWGTKPQSPTLDHTTYGLMPSGETVSLQVEEQPTK